MPELMVVLMVPTIIALFAVFFVIVLSVMDTPSIVDAGTSLPLQASHAETP